MRELFYLIFLVLLFYSVTLADELDQSLNIKNKTSIDPGSYKGLVFLRKYLLNRYERNSRPLKDSSKPIFVYTSINIEQISHLDELYQQMTTETKITLKWTDEYLQWNASVFSDAITFKPDEIWTPDLILNNLVSDRDYDLNKRNKYLISIQPNGETTWTFPAKFISTCPINQDHYPYEDATCSLTFRSSAYNFQQVKLRKNKYGLYIKLMVGAEFDLKNYTIKEYEQFNEKINTNFSFIKINLQMKRNSHYYFNKIIFPYCVFYITAIFTFLLPVDSGEKKSYCTSIFISALIFLKENYFYIPKTSVLPIISLFFSINLVLLYFSIVFSILVYAIYLNKDNNRLKTTSKIFKIIYSYFERRISTCSNRQQLTDSDDVQLKVSKSQMNTFESYTEVSVLLLALLKTMKCNIIKQNIESFENSKMTKLLGVLETYKNKLNNRKIQIKSELNEKSNGASCSGQNILELLHTIKNRLIIEKKLSNIKLDLFRNGDDDDVRLNMYCKNYEINLLNDTFKPSLNKCRINRLMLNSKWKSIAITIDRCLFVIYAFVTPLCLLSMYIKFSETKTEILDE